MGIFSGGFWPSVTRTSSSTVYPSAKVEHSEGYSQSQSGYFGGFYLGYDFKQAALPLCGDKKWKAIPAVAVVFNYGQISTSGFSYESQSLHPSYSNGSNQSFIPEIAAVVNFSNSSPFVPFVGFTLGAALSWLVDPSAINFQGKELLAPDQTAFGSAFTSKFIAGLAFRIFPHCDVLIAYTTRVIAPMDFKLEPSPLTGASTVISHSGWYQDFEGWGAIQYNFWP